MTRTVALVTSGEPAPGFWISGLTAQPSTVVVSGPEEVLATLGSAVPTLALDVGGAAGDVTANVALDVPPEVAVHAPEGQPTKSVEVTVRITARRGNLTIERPVELSPSGSGSNLAVTPERVELLLSGPVSVLQEIQADPDLVRVILEVSEESLDQNGEQMPRVIAPEGVGARLVPPTVTVSRRRGR